MSLARQLAPPLGVGVATFLCFSPVLGNGFVSFDDPEVLAHPFLGELGLESIGRFFTTVHVASYQPLTWLLYAVERAAWGMAPAGYHLSSLLLHTANAVLVYLLVRAVLRASGGPDSPGAAAAAALFFALHPLRVEPVAWLSARGQVQAAVFSLLTVLAYLRARRPGAARGRWLALSVASFAVCMLTRTGLAIALPAVLLLIDHFVLRRFGDEPVARPVLEKLPYLAISALALVAASLAKGLSGAFDLGGDIEHGAAERLLQAGYGLVFYPLKTLWPLSLSPLHPLERQIAEREPIFWLAGAASLGVTLLCVLLYRRWPAVLGAWLAYAVLVAPVLGFTQSGPQLVADRYSYHACMPFAVLLGVGLARLGRIASPARRRAGLAALAAVLLLLAGLSARQTRVWRDGASLWRHAVALDPESALLRLYQANHLREAGELEAALGAYDLALERGVHRRAQALIGRAAVLDALGRVDEALADADRAIELEPRNAGFHLNRGLIRVERDPAGALEDWTRSLRLAPGLAAAFYNRGILHEQLGDAANARADTERALALGLAEAERADAERRLRLLREAPRKRSQR